MDDAKAQEVAKLAQMIKNGELQKKTPEEIQAGLQRLAEKGKQMRLNRKNT